MNGLRSASSIAVMMMSGAFASTPAGCGGEMELDSTMAPASTPRRLVAKHSGKCLDVGGWSKENGASIIQWQCHGGANQQWETIRRRGAYRIRSRHSGKCLDVAGGSKRNGAPIIQHDCHEGANQQWDLISRGGAYQVRAKHSGKCLDVLYASRQNGAKIVQYDCHRGANQRFSWGFSGGAGGDGKIVGHIDRIKANQLEGWSCARGVRQSIQVHVYLGGAAGTTRGTYGLAARARQRNEAAVNTACQTPSGTPHRFKVDLRPLMREHPGKRIYVHGISPDGRSSNHLIGASGVFKVPSSAIPGGLLSIDFDDTCSTHFTVAAPALEARSLRGTYYLITDERLLPAHVALARRGHEVNSHTVTHPHLTQLSDEELLRQLRESKRVLSQRARVPIRGLASPFGEYDARTLRAIRREYTFHRTTDEGLNLPDSDVYRLLSHSVQPSETPAQLRALIDRAIERGGWQILLFHCLGPKHPSNYPFQRFEQVLDHVVQSGIRVVTASEGVSVLRAGY